MALYDPKKDYLPPDRSVPFRDSPLGKMLPKGVFENRVTEFNNKMNKTADAAKRKAGGAGLGAGAATTGATVNSGMGDTLAKPTLSGPQSPITDLNKISNDARSGGTIANQILLGKDSIPAIEYGPTPADATRSQESTRIGSNMNSVLGGGSLTRANEGNAPTFDRTNTPTSKGTFSTYEIPDYEGALSAMRDLRDYKLQRGAYEQEDRPMTVIGGYKSYSDDIAAYNAGDVGSEGYNRIRNERMQLQRQIDDATRGVSSSKAKVAIREQILGTFSEQQKARLANEADIQQASIAAGADQYKAGLEAQTKAADMAQEASFKQAEFGLEAADLERKREADQASQQLGIARLGLDQAKEAEGIRQFESRYGASGLEERKLGREEAEAVVSAQSRSVNDRLKMAELELESAKNQLGEVDPNLRKKILQKYGLTGPNEE